MTAPALMCLSLTCHARRDCHRHPASGTQPGEGQRWADLAPPPGPPYTFPACPEYLPALEGPDAPRIHQRQTFRPAWRLLGPLEAE